MNLLTTALTVCALGMAGAASAQSETEASPPIDPLAAEIIENAAGFLAAQDKLSVKWFVSYDTVLDGREKLTELRSGYSLLDRDDGYYGFLERGMTSREFFFDGASFTVSDPDRNSYAQIAAAGALEDLVERLREEYELELPIWSVLSMGYHDDYLADAERATYLGLTRVGGEVAHHIALSNYDEDWQVWIADDAESPRLLMLVGTDPYSQGWPQYRAYFTGWDFAPEIGEGSFTFVPGEDSEPMQWPRPGQN